MAKAAIAGSDVAAIGLTNQRETTVVWDRATGKPIHNAIVWQDRRTADRCDELRLAGHEEEVTARTGLLLDPYFSGTKIAWILDHVAGSRSAADKGALAAGTIECFLLWRLTEGCACTRPTPPMRRARCSSTSAPASGTRACARCSACLWRCCRRCATRAATSARPRCSADP
jgi:glycerol kinase